MASQISEKHIWHCMFFEFRKDSNAIFATKNICDVYPSALDVRIIPTTLDENMLRAEAEAELCQTIEELSNTDLSRFREYLQQQIEKITRDDIALWNFHLFQLLQHFLSGKKFENLDDVQNAISIFFTQRPIDFYRFDIENLVNRWQYVIYNGGDYIID